jgi:NTP pyrophosphatase (non-canonical NTP hydrolase)
MSELESITNEIVRFRDARDWEQFHNAKDRALAISIEAGELLEQFLWKDPAQADKEKIKEELADVFTFSLLLARKYGFSVKDIILEKLTLSNIKYPVEKSKGSAKKYNEL